MKEPRIVTPGNVQDLEHAMDMLSKSIQEMRRVAQNMVPESLVTSGLDIALKDFCSVIAKSENLQISYQSVGLTDTIIDRFISLNVYRIVRELIYNIVRHAAAKITLVQLTNTRGQLVITVEDDGKGFDPSTFQQSKGVGLKNIQHSVDLMKGRLYMSSQPGSGTSVLIEISLWEEGNIDC